MEEGDSQFVLFLFTSVTELVFTEGIMNSEEYCGVLDANSQKSTQKFIN